MIAAVGQFSRLNTFILLKVDLVCWSNPIRNFITSPDEQDKIRRNDLDPTQSQFKRKPNICSCNLM